MEYKQLRQLGHSVTKYTLSFMVYFRLFLPLWFHNHNTMKLSSAYNNVVRFCFAACPNNCFECTVNATSGSTLCKATGCYLSYPSAQECCDEGYGLVTASSTCKGNTPFLAMFTQTSEIRACISFPIEILWLSSLEHLRDVNCSVCLNWIWTSSTPFGMISVLSPIHTCKPM